MKIQKHFLFCPGPVNISQNVKEALYNEIGHREPEFSKLMTSVNSKLLKLYEIKNIHTYRSVFITGSGTAANESVLSSVVNNQNILIVSNGEFGERLYEISKIHNPNNTFILKFNWNEQIDIKKVNNFINENNIKIIAMVHHETSTGMLNPIDKIGKLAKKHNLIFIVDTISSVGAEKIDIEKWNITFCIGTSGKAIGSLPGVAFIIARKNDFEKLKDIPAKTMYLNLYKLYYYSITYNQTPNTPAVQLFFALEQAIKNILSEGVSQRRLFLRNKALVLRTGMENMGLSFHTDQKNMSSVLTTVNIPKYIEFSMLTNELKKSNIIIYNGKGKLANKVFQVGNIGEFANEDILYFLTALKNILDSKKLIYEKSTKKSEPIININSYINNQNYQSTSILLTQKE